VIRCKPPVNVSLCDDLFVDCRRSFMTLPRYFVLVVSLDPAVHIPIVLIAIVTVVRNHLSSHSLFLWQN